MMRKHRATPIGLAASCLWATAVAALEVEDFQIRTTGDLVTLCSADPGAAMAAEAQQACYGYLAGAIDFYRALTVGERIRPFICPGRELTRQELASILVDWAQNHEEHMDELPVESLVRATVARFPCES